MIYDDSGRGSLGGWVGGLLGRVVAAGGDRLLRGRRNHVGLGRRSWGRGDEVRARGRGEMTCDCGGCVVGWRIVAAVVVVVDFGGVLLEMAALGLNSSCLVEKEVPEEGTCLKVAHWKKYRFSAVEVQVV